ncbi:LysR family transcriptional regulator [Marinobacterium lutimaris]|uniref:DNA-binding transcriptional regulator, LysR family n=1 Tax=Marinobacterium lutimaris TaxID=568106 RepID=A0A1H6C9H9_9GAMM|nr:LysR family transcriptional regulator [Marinobacterium lutimaris]SEG69630.1 DNA-binding transcriptional regulator, LysR family [Marinobacterium lutimaris]
MSNVDLNLIRTFITLYELRSVTLAAEQLYVTQPSVSYALSRLRELFNDRLFVRSKEGMEPTAAAEQLYRELHGSLTQIETTLEGARSFDPSSSNKRFTLAMTDLGEMALFPRIFRRLQREAPNVELEVLPLEIDKVAEWMSTGRIDAVICSRPLPGRDINRQVILQDRYVCIMNGKTAPDQLSMDEFLARKHLVVSRSLGHGLAEEVLADLGLQRKVSLVLPHFSILPTVLGETDLLAIVPLEIAELFAEMHAEGAALKICPLPFEVPAIDVALYWSERSERSPALTWMRQLIIAALGVEGSGASGSES